MVETLTFSDKDETAEDYRKIQKAFGTDYYEAEEKQEVFKRFLKRMAYKP